MGLRLCTLHLNQVNPVINFHVFLGTHVDVKKSVLKTIAAMDLDKINMDLVENLLEWIVDGKHKYPPGKKISSVLG